ncbi:hypothetical protein BDW69DRAFT_119170 [Aspergillus filifer]
MRPATTPPSILSNLDLVNSANTTSKSNSPTLEPKDKKTEFSSERAPADLLTSQGPGRLQLRLGRGTERESGESSAQSQWRGSGPHGLRNRVKHDDVSLVSNPENPPSWSAARDSFPIHFGLQRLSISVRIEHPLLTLFQIDNHGWNCSRRNRHSSYEALFQIRN